MIETSWLQQENECLRSKLTDLLKLNQKIMRVLLVNPKFQPETFDQLRFEAIEEWEAYLKSEGVNIHENLRNY